MIVYEVNIDVAPAIEDAYYEWLLVHCEEMTHQIEGMRNFTICERDAAADSPGWKKGYTVSYFIETRESLDDYIANRAAVMRQQAVDTFGADQFKGTRRIMTVRKE
jgi:hypothetical protein